ncbi:MAG: MBL fold metallo-hydrolase [Mucilaginibacter sp.]|uniref:MBL fold metallo-hydrolase n=1 Tax=Mucilaginibacter sp. TaxID=1882438 RepID=UPI0031A31B86
MLNENKTIDRRQFLGAAGLLTASIWLSPKWLYAQEQSPVIKIKKAAATAKINVTKLRGNISVLEGSGGNIAVLNGPQGKLMVDGGIGVSKVNVSAALKSISSQPLKYLINTHWHFDHADGNEWLHEAGATIISHENTRKHLAVSTRVDDWNYTFPAAPKGALPTVTFKDEHTMSFNGETLQMKHYAPAHTDSDISVYFPNADILHVADTWWNGYYPFIDYNTGGNIEGAIKAANLNVSRTTDKTIIIPGHGPIGNRKQLIEFRDMLVDIHAKVSTLKKQGKSVNEVVALKPTAAYDKKWGGFVIDPAFFTKLVYRGA